MRLKWLISSFDNGRYFYKSMFMNYLKSYEEKYKIETLETELSIIKEQSAIFDTNKQFITNSGVIQGDSNRAYADSGVGKGSSLSIQMQDRIDNLQQLKSNRELDNTPLTNTMNNLEITQNTQILNANKCKINSLSPNIIKYPNLLRLEQDNGKVAVDSDGNIIMVGDYALVDIEGNKQLYKREIIANSDMWIKEDIGLLYKLIQDKKNKCISNPTIRIEDANMCIFDLDKIKCETNEMLMIATDTKHKLDMEKTMNDLQQQIDYIKNIPVLIANTNKEIITDRMNLINKLNSMKLYWKYKDEENIKLDKYIKSTIFRNKPCIHYKITDFFSRIKGYNDDRYEFARSIFRNFLNTETEFDNDFNTFDTNNNDNNFTYCNICSQQLLCNHIRLGVSYIEDEKPIDYNNIITLYTQELSYGYYCKACSEYVANTEVLDLEDFAKGDDGGQFKTREIITATPIIEQQKLYLNKFINELFNNDLTQDKVELQFKLNIFKLLKGLCGLEKNQHKTLTVHDEIYILNYLKSYNFYSKNDILQLLLAKQGANNITFLKTKMTQLYVIYLCCDIAARFLIILQTAQTPYELYNKDCNTNIIGYPLINDETELNGVAFITCILNQMSELPEYIALSNLKPSMFIDRIRHQVDTDNFVKTKIHNKINKLSIEINYIY